MEINFKLLAANYISNQKLMLKKIDLASKNITKFNSISINNFSFTDLELKTLELKNVIYFFKVMNCNNISAVTICKEITKIKDNKRSEFKLPKVNDENALLVNGKEAILYVGKSNGNFKTRINQHLGNESKKTYALHLKEWKKNKILKEVELELFYLSIDITEFALKNKNEELDLIEQLESVLHFDFKPILGRTGH